MIIGEQEMNRGVSSKSDVLQEVLVVFFWPNRLKMCSWCVRERGMRCQYITYSLTLCALIFPYIYICIYTVA